MDVTARRWFRALSGALLFVNSLEGGATAIVYVQYQGGYVVGADSLRQDGKGQEHNSHRCKLRIDGSVILATHGGAGWEATNAMGIAAPDLRAISQGVLATTAVRGAQAKTRELKNRLSRDQQFWNLLGQTFEQDGGWVFIDATGGYEGSFSAKDGPVAIKLRKMKNDALADTRLTTPYLAESIVNALPTRDHAIQIIGTALSLAAKGDPGIVSGPFSIATVDTKGVQWVERGVCSASSTSSPSHQ